VDRTPSPAPRNLCRRPLAHCFYCYAASANFRAENKSRVRKHATHLVRTN
jgi:hypothetical protein